MVKIALGVSQMLFKKQGKAAVSNSRSLDPEGSVLAHSRYPFVQFQQFLHPLAKFYKSEEAYRSDRCSLPMGGLYRVGPGGYRQLLRPTAKR